jgi:hypothetical protein
MPPRHVTRHVTRHLTRDLAIADVETVPMKITARPAAMLL